MDNLYSAFAYDDAFRTMLVECDDLTLALINFMFENHYDQTARIIRRGNEHFKEKADGSDDKRISDSLLEVEYEHKVQKYHIECESGKVDSSILVKLFEYETQIALDDSIIEGDTMRLTFPNMGLLVLAANKNLPNKMYIQIEASEGTTYHQAKVIKVSDFTMERIMENKLYFLIPFYLFNLKNQLRQINKDQKRLQELKNDYEKAFDRLDQEVEQGTLSAFSKGVMIRMTMKVLYKLANNYKMIQKEVGEYMGGRVLDLDIIRARHEGLDEGWKKGIEEGKEERDALRKETDESRKEADESRKEADESRREADALKKENMRLKAELEALSMAN